MAERPKRCARASAAPAAGRVSWRPTPPPSPPSEHLFPPPPRAHYDAAAEGGTLGRPAKSPAKPVTIFWNGRAIEAEAGENAATALHRAGIRRLGWSRKLHRPLGSDLVLGLQAQLDGLPNVRLDRLAVRPGLALSTQNVWPSSGFDLLRLARLIPARWVRGG